MGIQINGNTNNINAGIGSLSIEDINELDIVGVATAANFKTGVSNLHNVGLTLSGGQIDVGSNIKIGTAGVITATSFVGSGANLTGITQTTINNNANNRIITGSGSANTLEAESSLTYTNSLDIGGSQGVNITYSGANLTMNSAGRIFVGNGGNGSSPMFANVSDTNTGIFFPAADTLAFTTGGSERLRITSTGDILLNKGNNQNTLMSNTSDGSDNQSVFVGGGGGPSDTRGAYIWAKGNEYTTTGGYLQLNAGNVGTAPITFSTGGNERFRIDSSGRVLIGTTTEGFATYGDKFTIANSGHCGMTIRSGTSNDGNIYFSDGTSGVDEVRGFVEYKHSNNSLNLGTNAATRLSITSDGSAFVKSAGTVPENQAEAGHYSGNNYSAGHAMGLMVKRAIHVSDSAYKGQGGMFLSHSRHVACNGTTYNMMTIHNREGCLIGDVYVGFSASGSAAVRHYKFHCYYGASTLTNVNNPGGRSGGDSISANISSSNDAHFFQVTPNQNANSTQTVTMTIVGQSSGTYAGHYYTVSYN